MDENIDKAVEWLINGNSVVDLEPEVAVPEYGKRVRIKPVYTNEPIVSAVPINTNEAVS